MMEKWYQNRWGRAVIGMMTRPWISRLAGKYMDSPLSRPLIRPFIRRNGIDMTEVPEGSFSSFNAFFTRRLVEDARPVDPDPEVLIAPCDGLLSVYPIAPAGTIVVKGVAYTIEALLRNAALAHELEGGQALVFRLTPAHYHRFCFPADGTIQPPVYIPGIYHTVRPFALAQAPVFRENSRSYTRIDSDRFGLMVMMEVGALMVGRIVQEPVFGVCQRGAEKGRFEFGGSTIVLLLAKDTVQLESTLCQGGDAREIPVRQGQCMGRAIKTEK